MDKACQISPSWKLNKHPDSSPGWVDNFRDPRLRLLYAVSSSSSLEEWKGKEIYNATFRSRSGNMLLLEAGRSSQLYYLKNTLKKKKELN